MSEPTPNLPATRGDVMQGGPPDGLDGDDLDALQRAMKALEHQSFTMRIADAIGRQLGNMTRLLPGPVNTIVDRATEKALDRAMRFALSSLAKSPPRDSRRLHKAAAVASGAAGGMFGISSLPVELPISTVIILRSIAEIARNEGEDLADPEAITACLAVFALGAHEAGDTYADGGYFAMRVALAGAVKDATNHLARGAAAEATAPMLARLISQIGTRFGIVVSEKLAAQAVPVLGAAGGAAINYAFADHFQSLAWAHFTVRRLERIYGAERIRAQYDRMREADPAFT